MEAMEFDASIGGTEQLPDTENSLRFAASRSVEIAAMTESILHPSKTKLIFQCLPVHMRRRVMSHNCRRLPRRLREGHLEQLKKSGLPPKQKRPSRKYRRRATNLLEEYNRRQRKNVWMETHIWHSKRFHMIERWGHRLAYRPCDKAFRACYRASSAHCLIQDISYYTPIQVNGPVDLIKEMFSTLTSSKCGLGVAAKAYLNGNRQGAINLYMPNSYPFQFIGKVEFLWVTSNDTNKELWLFVHPSYIKQVESTLFDIVCKPQSDVGSILNEENIIAKRRKLTTKFSDIEVKVMSGKFNRFRLTGPKSHAVLTQTLKCVKEENIKSNDWFQHIIKDSRQLCLQEKNDYWNNITSLDSPSQLPPGLVLGLIVKDPRLSRPNKRTKAFNHSTAQTNTSLLINISTFLSVSPLWNNLVCQKIKEKKITNAQYIEHITKTQLVPGEVNEDDPYLQTIPIVLIQRPGSQNSNFKKIGYGSGWDIIIPSGYSLPFWLTFIMFGARSGGLRETESLAFEMGECYMPPDSEAGNIEEKRTELELKEKYFKRPPSKRVNYVKLAAPTPFICPWNILLREWANVTEDKVFVLRDRDILVKLQECIESKKKLPDIDNSDFCLVPVYVQIIGKGNLKKHAMICMPSQNCCANRNTMEPHHKDGNAQVRRQKKAEHKILLKQMRKKRIKLRRKRISIKKENQQKPKYSKEPSEYVKLMRELWLPSNVEAVRHVGSREVMGYLLQAAFSFSEAKSCGIGYVTYNALVKLLEHGTNQILVRNTTSRSYKLANIQVLKSQ